MLYAGLIGLVVGVILRVIVPYLREGLQEVAETGNFVHWPGFDYRYLAMVLLPLLEYGVAFLTVEGLWQTALSWSFIPAVAMGWAGTDIGKEAVQVVAAGYRVVTGRG